MSLAKKCDRCGKFYEHYPVGNSGACNAIKKVRRHLGGTVDVFAATIDLCPDCMAAFEKFMKDGYLVRPYKNGEFVECD